MNVNVGADEHTDGADDERRARDALEEVHLERRVRAAALLAHGEHAEHERRTAADVAAAHNRADAQACAREQMHMMQDRTSIVSRMRIMIDESVDWETGSGAHTEGASGVWFHDVVTGVDIAVIDHHWLFVDRHRVRRRLRVHHCQHDNERAE